MKNSAHLIASTAALFVANVVAQQAGTLTTETHPTLEISTCTSSGCTTQSAAITLDSNWRWLHSTSSSTNCYTGNTWNTTYCPDPTTCSTNCALDGADYSGTYGLTTSGNSLNINFVTQGQYSKAIGSRVYLMEPGSDSKYQILKLKNKEFAFDVDVSNLPCGLNGALYLVEMDSDGGMAKNSGNKAGAKYGTGYCDAQCPHDLKFINGEANILDWTPSSDDSNAGKGRYGACCSEMDIWESNSISNAYTPHPCSTTGLSRCSGTDCGDSSTGDRYKGTCDKDGCDFNPYRMGNTSFFGSGKVVDTSSKFTVVTQFITSDGTDSGDLTEIRRYYSQNGKVIPNSYSTFSGLSQAYNSVTDGFCNDQKTLFNDTNYFKTKGGIKEMGNALGRGMVLVMSLWDDHEANMLWLDSNYPTDKDASIPGVARGSCSTSSGKPSDVEANAASSNVKFSNIKWGALGSTTSGVPAGSGSSSSTTTTTTTSRAASSSTTTTTSRVASSSTTSSRTTTTTTTSRAASSSTTSSRTTTTTTTTTSSRSSTTSSASATACATHYGQCGGLYYTGATSCCDGYTCKYNNDYYSQCL